MSQCGPTHYRPIAEWADASNGSVPQNAVEVGYDGGAAVFVARAHHNGDNLPGKLVPEHGVCYVAWGGEEHSHSQYQVLVTPYGMNLEWVYTDGETLPCGVVEGGRTAEGEALYIGRVNHEGAMVSGKVQHSHRCLYTPFGGQEIAHQSFEILVAKSIGF